MTSIAQILKQADTPNVSTKAPVRKNKGVIPKSGSEMRLSRPITAAQ
jgi:hypothetical protein